MVQEAVHPDAHIIFGASIDENLDDELHITVVATGFDDPISGCEQPAAKTVANDQQPAAAKAEDKPAAEPAPAANNDLDVPSFINMIRETPPTIEREPSRATAEDARPEPAKKKREHDPFDDILNMFHDRNR